MEVTKVLDLSGDSGAILISSDDVEDGTVEKGQALYGFLPSGGIVLGGLKTGANNHGACERQDGYRSCHNYEGTISVVGEKTGAFPDLVVTYTGSDRDGKTPPSDRYQFDGKEYQMLVTKK